jgi:hypothetical protein
VSHYEVPESIARRILSAGGANLFGEPNYCVVWGEDRIVPITGRWDDNGAIETRFEPKYFPTERWHLEKWCPPEDYGTPEKWELMGREIWGAVTVDTAGPFPSRGDYELVLTLMQPGTGDFIALNATVAEWLVNLLVQSRNFSFWQRRQAIEQREERLKRQRIARRASMLSDKCPAFAGNEFSAVPAGFEKTDSGLVVPAK